MSFWLHIGKNVKWIAQQAGHASAGFSLDRYGHLMESINPTPLEWVEDLLWPGGLDGVLPVPQIVPQQDGTGREQPGERAFVGTAETPASTTIRE